MTLATETFSTPNYVLLSGKNRISPVVLSMRSGRACAALYGFSDKAPYDTFRASSETILTPFPLVKVYLQTLIDTAPENLHLVILDAAGPGDSKLRAATTESILDSHLNQSATVLAEYSLSFDHQANGYRIDEA
jgi:hypothetical protein